MPRMRHPPWIVSLRLRSRKPRRSSPPCPCLRRRLDVSCSGGGGRWAPRLPVPIPDNLLAVLWEHHVLPLLDEYFAGQPGRGAGYALDKLLGGERREGQARKRQA